MVRSVKNFQKETHFADIFAGGNITNESSKVWSLLLNSFNSFHEAFAHEKILFGAESRRNSFNFNYNENIIQDAETIKKFMNPNSKFYFVQI